MAETIIAIAPDRFGSRSLAMLDVACGTGHLLDCLSKRAEWHLEGLDADPEMLRIARRRVPEARFHRADMATWHIDRQFDIITCLGSSLAAVCTTDQLTSTFASMERHLAPGGIVLFDEFFTPEQWRPGTLSAIFIDEPDLKIARMSTSERHGDLAILNMAYLVATPEGIEHLTEQHELDLFDMDDYAAAFSACGLRAVVDAAPMLKGVYTNRGTHLLERIGSPVTDHNDAPRTDRPGYAEWPSHHTAPAPNLTPREAQGAPWTPIPVAACDRPRSTAKARASGRVSIRPNAALETPVHDVEADATQRGVLERLGNGTDDLEPERLPEPHGGNVGFDDGVELHCCEPFRMSPGQHVLAQRTSHPASTGIAGNHEARRGDV